MFALIGVFAYRRIGRVVGRHVDLPLRWVYGILDASIAWGRTGVFALIDVFAHRRIGRAVGRHVGPPLRCCGGVDSVGANSYVRPSLRLKEIIQ